MRWSRPTSLFWPRFSRLSRGPTGRPLPGRARGCSQLFGNCGCRFRGMAPRVKPEALSAFACPFQYASSNPRPKGPRTGSRAKASTPEPLAAGQLDAIHRSRKNDNATPCLPGCSGQSHYMASRDWKGGVTPRRPVHKRFAARRGHGRSSAASREGLRGPSAAAVLSIGERSRWTKSPQMHCAHPA